MSTIGVVTTSRADYGIYRPILQAIAAEPQLRLQLFVTGMHLAPEHGLTVAAIEADGFPIAERIEGLLADDSPAGIAASMGLTTQGFSRAFARSRPDLLLVLGDRFEMHAAALAALPFSIPMAHIHGGELTVGAIDDALRHCLTKLSHLHFVATEAYAARVRQLGEEPWRVVVSGAPGLDALAAFVPLADSELERRIGLPLTPAPLLVTFHPVTLAPGQVEEHIGELLAALDQSGLPVVFTAPNADAGGRRIASLLADYVAARPRARLVTSLGTEGYFSLMARAAAMVGNSSSGLIEAPSFALPVVNIGDRQQGRVRAANVLDVGYGRQEIAVAIARATDPDFRQALVGQPNPYGDGQAAARILAVLKHLPGDGQLLKKRFCDLEVRP